MWEDMSWPTPGTVARTLPKFRPLLIQGQRRRENCFVLGGDEKRLILSLWMFISGNDF